MDAGVGTPARPSTVGIWMTVGEGDGDYDGGLKDGDCQPPTVSTLDAGQWNVVFGRMPENCLLRTALAHSRGELWLVPGPLITMGMRRSLSYAFHLPGASPWVRRQARFTATVATAHPVACGTARSDSRDQK